MWSHSNSREPLTHSSASFSPLKDYFCSDFTEMDLKARIPVLSLTLSWILCTALSAPAAEPLSASAAAVGPQRHVRSKRCSCATFLDKECVYFCHLDIIWVNTPERVVSYGLGDAPRAKRALSDSMATARAPRCRCLHENDGSCVDFCLRSETAAGARIRSPGHTRSADTGGPDRTEGTSTSNRAWPAALTAVLRTRLQLEKWAARRHHRARAWQGREQGLLTGSGSLRAQTLTGRGLQAAGPCPGPEDHGGRGPLSCWPPGGKHLKLISRERRDSISLQGSQLQAHQKRIESHNFSIY